MIYREKIGIGCSTRPPSRLLSTWRCQVCAFSYSYRYESPHLIPSNVPEVLVFVKTKIRFDVDKNDEILYFFCHFFFLFSVYPKLSLH